MFKSVFLKAPARMRSAESADMLGDMMKFRGMVFLLAGLISGIAARGQTTLPTKGDVVAIMRKACDWQLAQPVKKIDNGWIPAAFYMGVMKTYETTSDAKYLDAAMKWSEDAKWQPAGTPPDAKGGSDQDTRGKEERFADNEACVQVYVDLYTLKKDEAMIAPARKLFDAQMADPKAGRKEWWWCDALFMAPAAFAKMSAATGEAKYAQFMETQWWDATDFLFDKNESLYYRDHNYFDKTTANGKKVFWGRGNGWVVAGTVRVLESLPADAPGRDKFVALHKTMCTRLATLQGEDGLWPSSLLDPEEFPGGETSGSAFYCYAMAWGINHGTLDREKYLPIVVKAWNGLVSKVTPDGKVGSVQKVAGSPGKIKAEDTMQYAVGGFLLAGSEMVKLEK